MLLLVLVLVLGSELGFGMCQAADDDPARPTGAALIKGSSCNKETSGSAAEGSALPLSSLSFWSLVLSLCLSWSGSGANTSAGCGRGGATATAEAAAYL